VRRSLIAAAIAARAVAEPAPSSATAAETATPEAEAPVWSVDGYYRARAIYVRNLANQPEDQTGFLGASERLRDTSYLLQRVRLEPRLELGQLVKLQLTADALDDVVWGDNNAESVAPLFASEPSNTDRDGETVPSIDVKRAWLEMDVKIGQLRVGRMPSHWGMGILANGGGTAGCPGEPLDPRQPGGCLDPYFDDDFGDNHFGTVYDRILFATRPIQVVKTLRGSADPKSNLIVAYAYDKLVEDYLNVPLEQQLYSDQLDDAGNGRPPSGPSSARGFGESAFLSRPDDDVHEHVVVLLYNDPDFDRFGREDEIRAGIYAVFRSQPKSRIVCESTGDSPTCAQQGPGDLVFEGDGSGIRIYSESEVYHVRGETDGGVPVGPEGRLDKTARLWGLASRWGVVGPRLDGVFELGHASGDDDIADERFTQRPLHPDYNVGLLLYEEVVRELTARTLGRFGGLGGYVYNSRSLQSNGGVINSWYVFPRVRLRPRPSIELVGGFVAAWWDAIGLLPPDRLPGTTREPAKFIGWEVNGAARTWWARDHLSLSLEAAYLRFGRGLRDAYRFAGAPAVSDDVRGAGTVQARLAFVF
jgi:hypothetical protein